MTPIDRPVVLFVSLPRALGGSNRSLVTLLESLSGSVHRVLASPVGGPFAEFAATRDVTDEWIELLRRGRFGRFRRVIDSAHIAWWSWRNRSRLHCIHANATTGLTTAAFAGFITRKPVVVWVHDPVSTEWGNRLGPWARRMLPDLRVAAVSSTAEAVAVDMGLCEPGSATIVPNPIDPDDVVFDDAVPHDGVAISLLGGTSHRKGFDLLPDVVERTSDLPITWLLYVNPDADQENGPAWEALSEHVDEGVRVPGRTRDVREAYAASDIVFVPSREESFCRVAAEAMMNGIPVVASDLAPLEFLLGDGAGVLFPVGDSAAAADAIRGMVESASLRKAAGNVGRQRSTEFMPSGVAKQMLRLYDTEEPT
jgi:glycosyltransferase involved in cell wall biosynthesis